MKKQKLHHIARIAALSFVGALPILGTAEAFAQQPASQSSVMPPIVSGSSQRNTSSSQQYSYSRNATKPLVPTFAVPDSKPMPPIVSGNQRSSKKTIQPSLKPIGSGVVKQVTGKLEPTKEPKIARAFSPAKMPVRTQGSSSRNIPAPAVQIPAPMSVAPSQIMSPQMMNSSPGVSIPTMAPSAPEISGSLLDPNAGAGPITVAPNYFDAAPVVDPVPMGSVVAGCSSCGNNSCSGGCDSCGDGLGYDPRKINCDYGTYGSVSAARRYAYIEALYMTREDGDITNSNFNPLGEFEFGLGWRFTLGQRSDMTQGREISYFGTMDVENRQVTTNAQNRLDALFSPAGAIVTGDLSSFFDANRHVQYKETNVHSLELNRVRWGWDVLKSFVGWRYVYMDDQYQLDSTSAFNRDAFGNLVPVASENGRYRIDAVNHLLGGHIGAELFYDIGYRFSLSGISKFGAYANINKVDYFLQNDGTVLLDTEDNGATISTTYELGFMAHYQLRQTARVRLGYNALFLGSVATVSDNFSPFVSPFTGFNSSDADDAFLHGFSFGLEIYR